jgi:hypothetical protein
MTWGIKAQRMAFGLTVIGALALASGANWIDIFNWLFSW